MHEEGDGRRACIYIVTYLICNMHELGCNYAIYNAHMRVRYKYAPCIMRIHYRVLSQQAASRERGAGGSYISHLAIMLISFLEEAEHDS